MMEGLWRDSELQTSGKEGADMMLCGRDRVQGNSLLGQIVLPFNQHD